MIIGRVFLEPHLQLNREGKSLESEILTILGANSIETNNRGTFCILALRLFKNPHFY